MNQQQLATAEAIARHMAATTTGLDAAYWLLAASLLYLRQNCKNGELSHNEETEKKNSVTAR